MAGRDPRSPEGDGKNGVAPGHAWVFAAYDFGVGVIGFAFGQKCLRAASTEQDPERAAERGSGKFLPVSWLKLVEKMWCL